MALSHKCFACTSLLVVATSATVVATTRANASAQVPAADGVTVVAFARHTFRGAAKTIGPQHVALADYGIDIAVPNLSYAEDATPRGLHIARDFASAGLTQAAALAVAALGEWKRFDGRWNEIRTDLATERTYWTALQIGRGLHRARVGDTADAAGTPVRGCPTVQQQPIDVVTARGPVLACIPDAVLLPLLAASAELPLLKARGEDLINTVRGALGAPLPAQLPAPSYVNGRLPDAYTQAVVLASILEMSAPLGPPLAALFPDAPSGPLLAEGRAAVAAGVNMLGVRFFTGTPPQLADAISVWPAAYMAQLPQGSHTLLLTHDDFLSALLRALGFIDGASAPDMLAIYPIETVVFAFGDNAVSAVRMRIQMPDPSGIIPGPYMSQLLWKGTRSAWEVKIHALNARAQSWDIGTSGQACLHSLSICAADDIVARY